jgi:uncharacterized protein DUF6968
VPLERNDVVAERHIVCDRPDGERIHVTLRIGKPYRASDVDWACTVEAEGLFGELADIHGVDSFQALVLAQGLLRNLLRHEAQNGSTFRWPDSQQPLDIEGMFS